jgi:ABC-type antimicrobial peptide transport system permease subunit
MGMRLVAGRDVAWQDTLKTERVGLVSESLARALAPDGNVLGRAVHVRTLPQDLEYVIIGVVSDASLGDPRETRPRVIYDALLQTSPISALNPNLLVDTSDPATAAAGVKQILQDFGRDYALEIISLDDVLARAPSTERMSATVAGAVSVIAVLIALIGVHGALAYSVARRTREIGVRLAIGAAPSAAAQSVLRDGLVVCALGVSIGLPIAALSARPLRTLMFGVSETDPQTFVAVALAFVAVGLIAGIGPARRAARVDPVIALRAE